MPMSASGDGLASTQLQQPVTLCGLCSSCALCNLSHRGGKLGSLNGNDYFLGALNLQISVALVVPGGSKCLESDPQTIVSLLLPQYLCP